LLGPPCLQRLPYRPRARHARHQAALLLQAEAQRPLTGGFTVRHHAEPPWEPQGETLLKGNGPRWALTGLPIAEPEAPGESTVPTDAETQQHLLELRVTIFGGAMDGAWGHRGGLLVCLLRLGLWVPFLARIFHKKAQTSCQSLLE
jgi:hypothetical protein